MIKRYLPLAVFLLGGILGFFLRDTLAKHHSESLSHVEVREGGFRYVSPLLECESSRDSDENIELKPLERKIRKAIEDQKKRNWLGEESVYLRRLNSGKWFSVNPVVFYYPASLMKVPVLMAVLKQAERDPHLLGVKIRFSGKTELSDLSPYFAPSKKLEAGKSYTMEELLNRMIVYSDNDALSLIVEQVGKPAVSRTFEELGLLDPFSAYYKEHAYTLTVDQYVVFLRVLYNASYLSREMSEKALDLLTKIEFRQGLVEGVPPKIPVAHKFGERIWENTSQGKELHDCGIIYYPAHPYLLCIMTRGDSFEYLDDGIKETSRVIYEELDRLWSPNNRKGLP
ncbi:MAG TPA: serine hydrolase [Thermodesulfovibrionales bacterium]|nr:serine hydrolase [Thermodesulfovibrionales bacterium]